MRCVSGQTKRVHTVLGLRERITTVTPSLRRPKSAATLAGPPNSVPDRDTLITARTRPYLGEPPRGQARTDENPCPRGFFSAQSRSLDVYYVIFSLVMAVSHRLNEPDVAEGRSEIRLWEGRCIVLPTNLVATRSSALVHGATHCSGWPTSGSETTDCMLTARRRAYRHINLETPMIAAHTTKLRAIMGPISRQVSRGIFRVSRKFRVYFSNSMYAHLGRIHRLDEMPCDRSRTARSRTDRYTDRAVFGDCSRSFVNLGTLFEPDLGRTPRQIARERTNCGFIKYSSSTVINAETRKTRRSSGTRFSIRSYAVPVGQTQAE